MKTVFKLFAYEFKNIYKQALIFAFISTFLFALSISVMCFSSDMVQGYKDYLDDYGYYTLWVREVEDIGRYEEVDELCDYLSVRASGITIWHPVYYRRFSARGRRYCGYSFGAVLRFQRYASHRFRLLLFRRGRLDLRRQPKAG